MTTPGKPVFGAGVLRYPQITSPNFDLTNPMASPANSWALLQSGLAYLFGVVLSGGTITGPDYIINTSGIFFYSGAPALGNLVTSIATAAGTDGFGNVYSQGINTYSAPGVGVQLTGSRLNLLGVGSTTIAFAQALGFAGAGTRPQFTISGPSNNDQVPQILLFGESADGTALAQVRIQGFSLAGAQGEAIDIQVNGAVHGTEPGTQNEETWHSLGTLAGYVVNAARYRLNALGEVEFDINVTGTGANAASVAFSVTLTGSPNYRPLTLGKTYPLATNLTIAAMTSPPRLGITTAGVVTIAGTANIANTINYVGGATMPLD